MCSWCWGFAPVISSIKEAYSDRVKIALMLGGLRPGTTEPMTPESREEILHHWLDVHRMTGQPFAFEGAMPEGFIYDTEPPSRAVIAVADIDPEAVFPYFKSVQEAFYARGWNVTRPDTLADLAEQHDIEKTVFLDRFHSDDIRKKTQTHFQIARQSGVRGFPTVVLQDGTTGTLLTHGYRPFEELQSTIDQWLARPE
ncbi:MAG: DsbA family protein [Gammaproteobacteria bacterium]|nr:DsbA family protein [Gammaproteobacteria bacterium]